MTNIPMINIPALSKNKAWLASQENSFDSCWQQFDTAFPTEEACLTNLCKEIMMQSNRCRFCGDPALEMTNNCRVLKCRRCHKETWITAGTFFERTRLTRPWLAAIWLMGHGVSINAWRFHKLVGIAYSTASDIFKKLAMVVENYMTEDSAAVCSSLFSILFCKRSRETPAKVHPVAEQEEIEKKLRDDGASSGFAKDLTSFSSSFVNFNEESGSISSDSEPLASLSTDANMGELEAEQKKVYECLSQTPILFDVLYEQTGIPVGKLSAVLTMLELAGAAQYLTGDRYVRCNSPKKASTLSPEITTKVAAFIEFIRFNFHGISRKYLQNYLAVYWCHVDKARWNPGLLLEACLQSRYISHKEILNYVSAPLVKILPCPLKE